MNKILTRVWRWMLNIWNALPEAHPYMGPNNLQPGPNERLLIFNGHVISMKTKQEARDGSSTP